MCDLCLIYFFFIKIFISVQKYIIVFPNISKFVFFSNVVKCIRPTYGNKEKPATLVDFCLLKVDRVKNSDNVLFVPMHIAAVLPPNLCRIWQIRKLENCENQAKWPATFSSSA